MFIWFSIGSFLFWVLFLESLGLSAGALGSSLWISFDLFDLLLNLTSWFLRCLKDP